MHHVQSALRSATSSWTLRTTWVSGLSLQVLFEYNSLTYKLIFINIGWIKYWNSLWVRELQQQVFKGKTKKRHIPLEPSEFPLTCNGLWLKNCLLLRLCWTDRWASEWARGLPPPGLSVPLSGAVWTGWTLLPEDSDPLSDTFAVWWGDTVLCQGLPDTRGHHVLWPKGKGFKYMVECTPFHFVCSDGLGTPGFSCSNKHCRL